MICRQITGLIDRYLDKKLDEEQLRLVESHIDGCISCKGNLFEQKVLLHTLNSQPVVTAPPNFTSMVMESIGELAVNRLLIPFSVGFDAYRLVFKRLGLSFVLAAAVMTFSLYIPQGYINALGSTVNTKAGLITEKASDVAGTLGNVNFAVKSFFRTINNSIAKLKEV